jgi:hypothetical protein
MDKRSGTFGSEDISKVARASGELAMQSEHMEADANALEEVVKER